MNCTVPTATTFHTAPLDKASRVSTTAHTNLTMIQRYHDEQRGPLDGTDKRGGTHARTNASDDAPSCTTIVPRPLIQRRVRWEQARNMTNDCVTTAHTAHSTPLCTMISSATGVVEHCYFYPAIPRELYRDCFWNKAEIQQMQANQVTVAQTYLSRTADPSQPVPQESPPLVRYIHLLYGWHGDTDKHHHEHGKTSSSNDNHSSRSTTTASSKTTMAAIVTARRALASSNHRGLEPLLTSWLNQHRLCITHQVLAVQRDCRIQGKSAAARSEILAQFCDSANEAPRHYAHQLALGDEEFVRQQKSRQRMFDEPLKWGVDETQPQEDTIEETHVNVDATTPHLPDYLDYSWRSRLSLKHPHQSGQGRDGGNGLARRAISFLSHRRGNLFSASANEI